MPEVSVYDFPCFLSVAMIKDPSKKGIQGRKGLFVHTVPGRSLSLQGSGWRELEAASHTPFIAGAERHKGTHA